MASHNVISDVKTQVQLGQGYDIKFAGRTWGALQPHVRP